MWRVPTDPSVPLPPPFATAFLHPRAVFVLQVVHCDGHVATVLTASLDRRVRSLQLPLPPTVQSVKDAQVGSKYTCCFLCRLCDKSAMMVGAAHWHVSLY